MKLVVLAFQCGLLGMQALPLDVCSGNEFRGPYGFLLTGATTIAGAPTPAVTVGRIVFGEDGSLSGYSSVSFKGLLLGNPVTGTYEVDGDCFVKLELVQSTSGGEAPAAIKLRGILVGEGQEILVVQTDAGETVSDHFSWLSVPVF